MDLLILKALRASLSRRLDGKRPAFGLLLGYRLSLYRKKRSSPMLEVEFKWRDGYSRLWFEIEDGCLTCYAECDDYWQGRASRLIRRTPLADPRRDAESSAWLTLLNHLKRSHRDEEASIARDRLTGLASTIMPRPSSPHTDREVRFHAEKVTTVIGGPEPLS
jgi:hypothetical protein